MITMLENPQFQSTINEALQNPQLLDMMIQQTPMLRNMGPGARQILQSPEFRRMMTDPEAIRSMTQMQRAMGIGAFGGAGAGQAAFPAPGVTNTTPTENRDAGVNSPTPNQTNTTGTPQPPAIPFAMFGNPGAAAGANPFGALFNTPAASPVPAAQETPATQPGTTDTTQPNTNSPNPLATLFDPAMLAQLTGAMGNATPQNPTAQQQQQQQQPNNPFANLAQNPLFQNPQLLQQMLQATGGGGGTDAPGAGAGALNPFLSMLGSSGFDQAQAQAQAQVQDTRPPEERYEVQLRQLNEMGFYEFERNVEALRRTGGFVQGAVEYLLNH